MNAAALDLARRARAGEPAALEEWTARLACVPALVRTIHAHLGSPLGEDELAEVAQDVLVALWAKLDRYDGTSAPETWAYGFASTQLLKVLERRRRSKLAYGLQLERLADESESEAGRRLEFEFVHVALERIGPPAQEVVRLKHFEELTFEEIGMRLTLSPNTAKTHYYRALVRLREFLAPLWREAQEERP